MKLNTSNVNQVFLKVLFTEQETPENAIKVSGIVNNFGFHPERILEQKENIRGLLMQLPNEFMASGGGGYSFLQACVTSEGQQWGEHRDMEQLFALGLACGLVDELLPIEMRQLLPGGMPYYIVNNISERCNTII